MLATNETEQYYGYFALSGYEWRKARLTSKLPGTSIRSGCR
jgi:hypothetical protein